MSPSIMLGTLFMDAHVSVQYAYFVTCTVILLAVFDFTTVVFIEQYRRELGATTIPALLATIFIILLFVIAASLNRFFQHLGYEYLAPFVFATVLLTYVAIFLEKNMVLKSYLSINSIALILLWVVGNSDRVIMPF